MLTKDNAWTQAKEACLKYYNLDAKEIWHVFGLNSRAHMFGVEIGAEGSRHRVVASAVEIPESQFERDLLKQVLYDKFKLMERVYTISNPDSLCTTPRPIAVYPELGCIMMEYVTGIELTKEVLEVTSLFQRRKQAFSMLVKRCEYLAGWLARLHKECRLDNDPSITIDKICATSEKKIGRVYQMGFISADEISSFKNVLDCFAKEASRLGYSTIIHGDFCPANVIIDGERSFIIDFHCSRQGLPYEDVAYFWLHLDGFLAEPYRFSRKKIGCLKRQFIDCYEICFKDGHPEFNLAVLDRTVQCLQYYVLASVSSKGIRKIVNRRRAMYYKEYLRSILCNWQISEHTLVL